MKVKTPDLIDQSSLVDSAFRDVSIQTIPVEILAHIFSFASPLDRRNAKLVCKKWHEAGSCLIFSRQEKWVFRGLYNTEEMLLSLYKTREKFLNLEFLHFKSRDPSILMPIRAKVYFLSFIDCELDDDVIYELIMNCTNLQQLFWKGNKLCFNRNLFDLIAIKQIKNENLKAIKLYGQKASDINDEDIHLLFEIFPNIRQFSFQISTLLHDEKKTAGDSPSFSLSTVINEVISLSYILEKLKVTLYEPQWRLVACHNFTKLKEISVFIPDNVPDRLVFDFLSSQECLERISCTTIKNNPFPTQFFEHIVCRCSQLKHLKLKFRISCVIYLSQEVFRKLISSKLLTLTILNSDIKPDVTFIISNFSFSNSTLRSLSIPLIINYPIQLLFIHSFQNLKYLELQCVFVEVLESILKLQQKLKCLKLTFPSQVSSDLSDRLTGQSVKSWDDIHLTACLRSFTSLEYLALTLPRRPLEFICNFIPVSVKYLYLYASGIWSAPNPLYRYMNGPRCDSSVSSFPCDNSQISSVLSLKKLTKLEVFHFRSEEFFVNNLHIFPFVYSSWHNLRELHIDCAHRTALNLESSSYLAELSSSEKIYKEFLECCPSLRLFVLRTAESYMIYHYDYLEKKMKKNENIANYTEAEKIRDSKIKHRA